MRARLLRVALLALLLAGTAAATTLRRLSLEEVATGAREIVVATVRGTSVVAGDGPRRLLYTDVELERLDVWKGGVPAATVTYRFAGGTLGERTVRVAGVPVFETGARYVLFAAPEADALCPLVGWPQGRYLLRTDPKTRVEYVHDSDGHPVYGFDAGAPVREPSAERPRPLTLVEFQVEVLRVLEAAAARAEEAKRREQADGAADADADAEQETEKDQPEPPAGGDGE